LWNCTITIDCKFCPGFIKIRQTLLGSFYADNIGKKIGGRLEEDVNPIDVVHYLKSVETMCDMPGMINYNYTDRSHEEKYTKDHVLTAEFYYLRYVPNIL
jgi:hypothetical protein